jgi:predicted nucleic acid-binding protein
MECLVIPLKTENTMLINACEQLLSFQISLVAINQTMKSAASLRATTNLKTPDAIHAVTALDAGCTIVLTNDNGFRNVPNRPVVIRA